MKYTNKYNLPDYVVAYLTHDEYDHEEGVWSATSLMKPIRMAALEKRYDDELVMDVSDLIAAKYGTDIHNGFERAKMPPGFVQEMRLYAEVIGHRISGKIDLRKYIEMHKAWKMIDIKSTSVWKYIFGEFKEFIKQLSIYRFICEENDIPTIDAGEICLCFTDWKKSEILRNKDYPKTRIMPIVVSLTSVEDIKKWIAKRLLDIMSALKLPDDRLPLCPDEELWRQPDKWVVMKQKRKSALKVHLNEVDAMEHADNVPTGYVVHRPGKVNRCAYCRVCKWCTQYQYFEVNGLVSPMEGDE